MFSLSNGFHAHLSAELASLGCSPNQISGDDTMYSPSIITTELALLPLPVAKGSISSVLPLDSFSEGAPFLVEIPPHSSLGPMDLNSHEQDSSLILDSKLSPQTDHHPVIFWSKSHHQARS
ncbi:MAG: hypothetical protein P8O70_09355 [SAR324 cluster bacterium]|nr:hypothetical protein [SAR324 cluster bacterium]